MRMIGLLLFVVGAALVARPWVPALAGLPMPLGWASGCALAIVGLILLVRPRRAPAVERDPFAEALTARDFTFADEAHGWRARGTWRGRPIEIRRVRGYEASRFGLERVVEVTVRGSAPDPWPMPADEARLVDRRDHAVSVALPSVSRPGGEAGFGAQLDRVLAQVAPERPAG